MIEKILFEIVKKAGFECILSDESYSFFVSTGDTQRYLIFAALSQLPEVDQLHEIVLSKAPLELSSRPGFNKNCDLVLMHMVDQLAEYDRLEKTILNYEEDPYFFKKYFLYYTKAEGILLKDKNPDDLIGVLSDQAQFSDYKNDPRTPSLYGVAARIFIKIPFLEMPWKERELIPLSVKIDEVIADRQMTELWEKFHAATEDDKLDEFIQKIVNEELENIKNSDTGI
ncbi:ABC-three component system middle component 1 [Paraburkholderia sp. J76]|uniref:ABC-three component system middle component 1 n=1 Tax=Paraburkholderia sp. J76 TaxID=2805439 RepID=UPI002ABE3C45|nr:ABC-three component system middle component 1 [Paraburkholderia sp. J76]